MARETKTKFGTTEYFISVGDILLLSATHNCILESFFFRFRTRLSRLEEKGDRMKLN